MGLVRASGQWRCFICGKYGMDGNRGFMRHYDTQHLDEE